MGLKTSRSMQVVGFVILMAALAGCGAGGAPTSKQGTGPQSGVVKVDVHAFEVEPDITTAHAGPVTFHVTNTDVQKHEMLVVPLPDAPADKGNVKAAAHAAPAGPLEEVMSRMVYDPAVLRLNEDHLGSLGEVAEIEGGTSGEVTLDLPAGTYLLLCNLPNHFQSGMWAKFTVTR
ncbi:MAG: hypothetical protein HGA45_12995 [Chloroflexales bacterium]|nr:hypothetical protein [Chloroflexales bacterium]